MIGLPLYLNKCWNSSNQASSQNWNCKASPQQLCPVWVTGDAAALRGVLQIKWIQKRDFKTKWTFCFRNNTRDIILTHARVPVVVFESVFVLTVWADSRKVSKHQCTFYLFESFHLAGELAMDEKKRGSGGNTIRHLRQVVKRCICLIQAHTHTHTQQRGWSTRHTPWNRAKNAIPKHATGLQLNKSVIVEMKMLRVNPILLQRLGTKAEQMTPFPCVSWAQLSQYE